MFDSRFPPYGLQLSRRRQHTAFTLLELIAVTTILGLMLFIVLPNLDRILPTARVNGAAREIAATFDFARSQAIFTGKAYEVQFNLDERWYQMLTPDQLSRGLLPGGIPPRKAYLPKNIAIRDILFATGTKKQQGLVKIRVSPFGRFDEFVIHLVDARREQGRGEPWTVYFNPLTGLAEFYDHEKNLGQVSEDQLFRP